MGQRFVSPSRPVRGRTHFECLRLQLLVVFQEGRYDKLVPDQLHCVVVSRTAVIFDGEKLNQSRIGLRKRLHSLFGPSERLVVLASLAINLGNLKERISVRKITAFDFTNESVSSNCRASASIILVMRKRLVDRTSSLSPGLSGRIFAHSDSASRRYSAKPSAPKTSA